MFSAQLTVADIGESRFALSPMVEVTHSLGRLRSARTDPTYREWFDSVHDRLDVAAPPALTEAVARCPRLVAQLCVAHTHFGTSLEEQLQDLRDGARLRLAAEGCTQALRGGRRELADLLWRYWTVALAPRWSEMRVLLQEDVAFRGVEQTRHGPSAMIRGLHPTIGLTGGRLTVRKPGDQKHLLTGEPGNGLVLVPSVFCGPDVVVTEPPHGPPHLVYPARGLRRLWSRPAPSVEGSLAALLGRRRAAILTCLDLPRSTSELAVRLGQSPPSVSQHLSVLRRSGLVTSWRSGRWVLYRQTPLATDIVAANDPAAVGEA